VLGKPVVDRVVPIVEEIVRQAGTAAAGSVDVKVALAGGRALSGTVAGVSGDVLRTVTYSRVNARHRLAAWVRLLALAAGEPGRPVEAVTIGKARADAERGRVTVARLRRPDDPVRELQTLVDLYDRGMREPLPLACLSSAAYVQYGEAAARAAWESGWNRPGEDAEPEHVLALGGNRSFAELLAERPRPGEDFEPAEPTRFGRFARRLWSGLLAHERLEEE
jgi:exodeoxyribonuclease V gamma subunit